MHLGYNTNGFAHHRLDDAIAILADIGYQAIGLTVDHHVLNPNDADFRNEAERIRRLLERHRMRCVVETGARFLLDPRRKHQPTLLSPTPAERAVRLRFLETCIDLAATLNADAVSFWSGAATDSAPDDALWGRLTQGCQSLIATAKSRGVKLAFEPEPGMFVDTMVRFGELLSRIDGQGAFGLTMDLGHLHCLGETPIAGHIERWRDLLWNVHIEDMHRGVHDHLMFGEGDMEFASLFKALKKIGYAGGVYVELSRHSHNAVRVAERSLEFLKGLVIS